MKNFAFQILKFSFSVIKNELRTTPIPRNPDRSGDSNEENWLG